MTKKAKDKTRSIGQDHRIDRMVKGQEKKKYWTGSQDKQDFI